MTTDKQQQKTEREKVQEAQQKALAENTKSAEEKAKAVEEAQEPDRVEGQQTGESHYVVTQSDVHVEPVKAEVIMAKAGMDKRRGRPRKVVGAMADDVEHKVDYASKAELEVPAKEQPKAEGMAGYIREMEDKALARGATLVEVSHPDARDGIYQGRFGNVRLSKGSKGVKFSDGLDESGKKRDTSE